MRSKRSEEQMLLAGRALRRVIVEDAVAFFDRVRDDLLLRGIDEDLSGKIAAQLCEQNSRVELSSEQYEAMIDGASLACGVRCNIEDDSQSSVVRVREIERMMQAFAGELTKLNENLDVMATYVRRMRNRAAPKLVTRESDTVH